MKTNLDLGLITHFIQKYPSKVKLSNVLEEYTSSFYFHNQTITSNVEQLRSSYIEIDRVGYTSHAKGDTVEKYIYVVTKLYSGDGTYLDYADVILSKADFSDMYLTRQDELDIIELIVTRALVIITNRFYREKGGLLWLEK